MMNRCYCTDGEESGDVGNLYREQSTEQCGRSNPAADLTN